MRKECIECRKRQAKEARKAIREGKKACLKEMLDVLEQRKDISSGAGHERLLKQIRMLQCEIMELE